MPPDLPSSTRKDRYPGMYSFEPSDERIFFGRDREKRELLQLVQKEKLVIFYSKSGLGKSSLINAGLTPLLALNHFHPIRIRFQVSQSESNVPEKPPTPLDLVMQQLKALLPDPALAQETVPTGTTPATPEPSTATRLWENFKRCSHFQKATPVLIFDQFEEFFYYPPKEKDDFLDHEQAPARILDAILDRPESERTEELINWGKQLEIRIIIVIRADNVYQLDHLKLYIPSVLRIRYELPPLSSAAARQAIVAPALIEDPDRFNSPCFTYKEGTLTLLLNGLRGENDEIESSQLQMICSNIEGDIKKKFSGQTEQAIVDERILPNEKAIERKLYNYYRNQLATIRDSSERKKASDLIEDQLVVDGRRSMMLSSQVLTKLNGNQNLIKQMLDAKLIREEVIGLRRFYEISHDKLLVPINKRIFDRKEAEYKAKMRQDRKEALRLAAEQKKKAEEQKIQTVLQEKEAAKQRKIARDQAKLYNDQIVLTARVRNQRKMVWIFAVIAAIGFLAAVLFLINFIYLNNKVRGSFYKNALTLGYKYYQQNNQTVAFRLYQEIARNGKGLVRDSADHLQQHSDFYDIAGGEELLRISGNQFLVHNEDKSLCLFTLQSDSLRTDTVGSSAVEYYLSPDSTNITYRDLNNAVYNYHLSDHSRLLVSGIKLHGEDSRNGGDPAATIRSQSGREGYVSFNMNYIPYSNFLGYIDSSGQIGIVDVHIRKRLPFLIRHEYNSEFLSFDIRNRLKISSDNAHLVVWRDSSLKRWNIQPGSGFLNEDSIGNVTDFYNGARPDVLVYRLKHSTRLYIRPMMTAGLHFYDSLSLPVFSPNGNFMIAFDMRGDMFVYDLVHNFLKTVVPKVLYALWAQQTVTYSPLAFIRFSWQADGGKLIVRDSKGQLLYVNLIEGNYGVLEKSLSPAINSYLLSPGGQYYVLQYYITGRFLVKDVATSRLLFTDTTSAFNNFSTRSRFSAEPRVFFYDHNIAYTSPDSLGRTQLHVKDLASDAPPKDRSYPYNYLMDYTGQSVEFGVDGPQRAGIILLNDRPRTVSYYDSLYPSLSVAQLSEFGLNYGQSILGGIFH